MDAKHKVASMAKYTFADRMLVEALRIREEDAPEAISPAKMEEAEKRARRESSPESAIIKRALLYDESEGQLRDSVRAVGKVTNLAGVLLAGLFLFGGMAAATAALAGTQGTVNIFNALGALLGAQTVVLLLWVVLALLPNPPGSSFLLGSLTAELGRLLSEAGKRRPTLGRLLSALLRMPEGVFSAASASLLSLESPQIRKWWLSRFSHTIWAAFNVGVLLSCFWFLAFTQRGFVWETTILSQESLGTLVELLAWLPGVLGFAVPDLAVMGASELNQDPYHLHQSRQVWGLFLIYSILFYGLLPRLLLFVLSGVLLIKARTDFRLNLGRRYFMELRSKLTPVPEEEIVDPAAKDDTQQTSHGRTDRPGHMEALSNKSKAHQGEGAGAPGHSPNGRASGDAEHVALIGYEIEPPATGWPPVEGKIQWLDLGFVDGKQDVIAATEALEKHRDCIAAVAVVIDFDNLPSRGVQDDIERFINYAGEAALVLVLTGASVIRQEGTSSEQQIRNRINDWNRVLEKRWKERARLLDLDLDCLTDAGSTQLIAVLTNAKNGNDPEHSNTSSSSDRAGIDAAIALIGSHVSRWKEAPSVEEQAALQSEMRALYAEDKSLPSSLGVGSISVSDPLKSALELGERAREMLPDMREAGRWIEASQNFGPLFILGLMKEKIGAFFNEKISGLVKMGGGSKPKSEADSPSNEYLEQLQSALDTAFFSALLFEMQGIGEIRISKVLAETLEEAPRVTVSAPNRVRQEVDKWLFLMKERFDGAYKKYADAGGEIGE